MIYGVTHNTDGTPRKQLAIGIKVAIGEPAKEGRNYPTKLDHFVITTKNPKGEWIEDKALTEELQEHHSPAIEDGVYAPLREFDVVFLSNDIEEVFKTEFAWWTKTEKKCHGNGQTAMRRASEADDETREAFPGQDWVPWSPCGPGCPELAATKCKPSGKLFFILADRPRIGSVCVYYTTSYQSVRQIHASLLQIQDFTSGRLRGIPLKMVIRPGKTTYTDAKGVRKTSHAFFVHIEFRHEDREKLIPSLLAESVRYEASIEKARSVTPAIRQLGPAVAELPEQEEGDILGHEFYVPEGGVNETETGTSGTEPAAGEGDGSATDEMKKVDGLIKALGLNAAKKEMLLSQAGGDIERALAFLTKLQEEVKRLNATADHVSQWFEKGVANPSWLFETLKDMKPFKPKQEQKAEKPKGTRSKKSTKKKEAAAEKPPEQQPEPEPPTPGDEDDEGWNF